jgi:hypothetical protein
MCKNEMCGVDLRANKLDNLSNIVEGGLGKERCNKHNCKSRVFTFRKTLHMFVHFVLYVNEYT